MWKFAVMFALLAVAARAQFPFTDQPLEESIHSNKVFFDVTDVKEMAGVWNGINSVFQVYLNNEYLYDGVSQYNMSCDQALGSGWDYDYFTIYPRAMTIEVDKERVEEGLMGYIIESGYGVTQRFGISEYSSDEHTIGLQSGACRRYRPYLDWELGKTMLIRNIRYYFYPDENGITKYNELEGCTYAEVDHPQCFDGTFEIDGETHTGVVYDLPEFFECIAGPCLDLPFTLDGFVQTQGYVPAWAVADDSTATNGK